MENYMTAESVCKCRPDKRCDPIADSILDACLRKDKNDHFSMPDGNGCTVAEN